MLTAFDLEPDHHRYFIRPVSREEAETNTACTAHDLRASDAAPYIPGCHVVVVLPGLFGTKKARLTPHSTRIWRMWTCSLVKKHSRIWTSNLPSRRRFPNNPSFGCCSVIPNRALVEWPMDRELIARSYLKLPLGYEPPLPGTCHMRYQVSFTCFSGTVEALATLISKKRPPQWATGHFFPRVRRPCGHGAQVII